MENIDKVKLNNRFCKNIQFTEDLDRIVIKGNVTIVLLWNDNSATWNKEAELNTLSVNLLVRAHNFVMNKIARSWNIAICDEINNCSWFKR